MASIQSTQKYMNIMAAALQIVTKIPQTFNEIFASQDYEEISTFVTTTLVKRKLNKWTYIHFYGILFP